MDLRGIKAITFSCATRANLHEAPSALLSEHDKLIPPTWEDVLDVPGERPVQGGVGEHHDDGQGEGVGLAVLRTAVHVVPLNPDALLLVFGKVFAAVAKGHTREDALESRTMKEKALNSRYAMLL